MNEQPQPLAANPTPQPSTPTKPLSLRFIATLMFIAGFVAQFALSEVFSDDDDRSASPSCVQALDRAEDVIRSSGRAFDAVAEAFDAILVMDTRIMDRSVAKIDTETASVERILPQYQIEANKCRNGK